MLDFIEIGSTGKSHGVHGAVRLQLDTDLSIENMEVIFLKYKGDIIPYFIESIENIDGLVVKFQSVSSPENAKEITGLSAYVATKDIDSDQEFVAPIADVKGFVIYDGEKFVGEIKEIQQFPQQIMAIVEINEEEVMIPLAEGLIEEISIDERFVRMELPEGLI